MDKSKTPGTWIGTRRDIDCNGDNIEILTLSDLHVGDAGSNSYPVITLYHDRHHMTVTL